MIRGKGEEHTDSRVPPFLRGDYRGVTPLMVRIFNRCSEKLKRQSLRNVMPQAEKLLWEKLRRRQVLGFRFRRQYSVEGYIIDFYCPELRLAIEVDGDSHFQKGSQEKDRRRQIQVEALGIHFFRVRNVEVFEHIDDILLALVRKVQELWGHGYAPPYSPPLVRGDESQVHTDVRVPPLLRRDD